MEKFEYRLSSHLEGGRLVSEGPAHVWEGSFASLVRYLTPQYKGRRDRHIKVTGNAIGDYYEVIGEAWLNGHGGPLMSPNPMPGW